MAAARKYMLLAGVAAWAMSSGAWAQGQSSQTVEEIVVTGQRAADRNAIAAKRDTVQVMDAISADDIGQMADFSVGDALKRIAGVSVYDYQGEPRFASIRGFNAHYITTTLDGLQIASPDSQNQTNGGGRQFYLETLPSNIASRMEVYKTSTPDMDGHSVGGSVNFKIPGAFDFRKDQTRFSAKLGYQIQDKSKGGERPVAQAEAFVTRRFGADEQFGLMLSASYWRREMWIPQLERGSSAYWYDASGKNTGQPYVGAGPTPVERRWYAYDNTRERRSLMGVLDWRASENLSVRTTGYYFGQNEKSLRNDMIASIGSSALVSNQTATSGVFSPRATSPGDVAQNVRSFKLLFDRKVYGLQSAADYQAGDWKLGLKLAASRATYNNPQISDNFSQNGLSFRYDVSDDEVAFTPVNQTAYNNLAAYVGGTGSSNPQHYDERYKTDGRNYEGRLKAAYNMDTRDTGLGFEFGGGGIRRQHGENYAKSYQTGMPYTLADVASTSRICALNCDAGQMFVIDQGKLIDMLDRYLATVPKIVDTASAYSRTFWIQEDVYAAYGMARWKADRWTVQGGLRLEATDVETTGFRGTTKSGKTTYDPVSASSDYSHWMPSAQAIYDLASDKKIRAAYSRTIGRPKLTDMALLGGSLNLADASLPKLTTGNPDLKPRVSDNFDVSLEWYLDEGKGMASLALFHKRIQNEIYSLGRTADIDVGGGVLVQGVLTTAVNADEAATTDGVEVNFIKYLTFLPGVWSNFGLNFNAIASKTDFPIKLADGTPKTLDSLPGQPKYVTNLSVFYEGDKLRARVAWNHTDWMTEERYISNGTTSAANFYRIRWVRPADKIDASLSYELNRIYTLRIDGSNLTGQGVNTNMGLDKEIPVARIRQPRAVMVGVSARF
ncbi:TonB-dependent receptor [Caulobacter vibrioides]|uniref:TonB-dependent receptor n=1 Tax=Caulobacter vibrioides (strain NA1000 / CB15N) TaxID=565050 RepID=A0A0H3C7M0_CAUVN|nr:TonB-dependent receptor [Caulobacter vibrioides]YP_002517242.1 TonB-dependent receptor [Caulobacter vibrioides NA1000]ACL95334.1 TonB-dependent receptor [Caulobacter vibrioides NA1000]ATC28668.1 TonB-dependent receptor [Caulobacter vibrioides]AZH12923.1 TonB-dependent receptor [Caulobacter vibrioides]QXZ53849.1 TonB-dependent receptor [Caulobacter vibrioides]